MIRLFLFPTWRVWWLCQVPLPSIFAGQVTSALLRRSCRASARNRKSESEHTHQKRNARTLRNSSREYLGRLGRIVNACWQSLIQKGADPGPSISAWLLKRPNRQDGRIVHAQVPIKQTQSSSCGSSNVLHSALQHAVSNNSSIN